MKKLMVKIYLTLKATNYLYLVIIFTSFQSCNLINCVTKKTPSHRIVPVSYDYADRNFEYSFYYDDTSNNSYLKELRDVYKLDSVTQKASTNLEVTLHLLNWTSCQWKHNGYNKPDKSDALSILNEVKNGKSFRCVEYGIVASTAMASMGFPTRIIGLKTRDVEHVKYGAGHVAAEVFLPDLHKWVFIDAQFNAIPILNGTPLNAVEFKRAIIENSDQLILQNLEGRFSYEAKNHYLSFITKYLFFIDVPFDNRTGYDMQRQMIGSNIKLMLVPKGSKNPRVFQQHYPIEKCAYTNNYNDFYTSPF